MMHETKNISTEQRAAPPRETPGDEGFAAERLSVQRMQPARWCKDLAGRLHQAAQAVAKPAGEVTGAQLALLHKIIDGSFGLGRPFLRVRQLREAGGPLGLSDGAVSELLNGWTKRDSLKVRGLRELKMVSREEMPDAPGQAGGWLVWLNPCWWEWDCRGGYAPEELAAWRADVDGLAREYERQSVAGEIEERFCLARMLPWLAVENAHERWARERGESRGDAADVSRADARLVSGNGAMRDARPSCHGRDAARTNRDARNGLSDGDAGAMRGVPSENPKPEIRATALGFGKSEAAPVKQLNRIQQRTVQLLNSFGSGEDGRLLGLLHEQFVRVHGKEIADREMQSSGGCWRMIARAWPEEFETQIAGLRQFLDQRGKIKKTAWAYVQFYFAQAMGMTTWADVCAAGKKLIDS